MPEFAMGHPRELPARCAIGWPMVVERYWSRFPVNGYEACLVPMLMARGASVPGHPASCATPGCGHALILHRARTRTSPCQVASCPCQQLERQGQGQYPWAVPARTLADGTHRPAPEQRVAR